MTNRVLLIYIFTEVLLSSCYVQYDICCYEDGFGIFQKPIQSRKISTHLQEIQTLVRLSLYLSQIVTDLVPRSIGSTTNDPLTISFHSIRFGRHLLSSLLEDTIQIFIGFK